MLRLNALAGIVVSGGSRPPVCESSGGSRVALLPPGGRERCEGVHVVSQGDLDRAAERDGRLDLVFSARSGEANTQALVPIRLDIRPGLSLERSHSFVADGGTRDAADRDDTIAHVYVVTNSGNVTIEDVFISDRQSGTGRRTPVASETMIHDALPLGDSSDRNGNDGRWSRLAPGDSVLFAATYTVTQADLDRQVTCPALVQIVHVEPVAPGPDTDNDLQSRQQRQDICARSAHGRCQPVSNRISRINGHGFQPIRIHEGNLGFEPAPDVGRHATENSYGPHLRHFATITA